MYFPYLRGKQFELIAIRELVESGLMNDSIIPVIEPIKPSTTLLKTLSIFARHKKRIAVIHNPQVGNFTDEYTSLNDPAYKHDFQGLLQDKHIINAHILNQNSPDEIASLITSGFKKEDLLLVHKNPDFIDIYQEQFHDVSPAYNLVPYDINFKRKVRSNKVLLADRFPKLPRNVDYLKVDDQPFSEDHLFFPDEGYIAFSDFSIVGEDFTETGFAPMAVAIHIVYLDNDHALRIKHFVSDSNEDISDPAGKFYEALHKLMTWEKKQAQQTEAIDILRQHYHDQTYPGLGSLKKLSIMHHIELISRFLDGGNP